MSWDCVACSFTNEELAEVCSGPDCPLGAMSKPDGREYTTSSCCGAWIPKYWVHPKVEGCYGCMSVSDYLRRIAMIENPWERSAWLAKHDAEIQSMPQEVIEEVMNCIYMGHREGSGERTPS